MASVSSPVGSFVGPLNVPGASGNSNPLANAAKGGIANAIPTIGGLFQSEPGSFMDYFNQSLENSPGAMSIPNLLSNTANSIFGTNLQTAGIDQGGAGSAPSALSEIFLRSVIIILGFIFTAVGLSMFGKGK